MAIETWNEIADSNRSGLDIGEESITDYRLLEIYRRHSEDIVIHKFTKPEEGGTKKQEGTGADWEWWFISGDEGFGMLVQAKKLFPSIRYESLLKRNRENKLQVSKLLKCSKSRKLFPIYCFYNCWDQSRINLPDVWNDLGLPLELWGCSIANAYSIRKQIYHKRDSLRSIFPYCIPLSCLFCCYTIGLQSGKTRPDKNGEGYLPKFSLPHRARNFAEYLLDIDPQCKKKYRKLIPFVSKIPEEVLEIKRCIKSTPMKQISKETKEKFGSSKRIVIIVEKP